MMTDTLVLPTKFAPLSQLGMDTVTNWARANPEAARDTAALLAENPRAVIERFFRLTSDQQAGLAEVSDSALRALVGPLVERWRAGRFPQVELQFEYETVPAVRGGLNPVGADLGESGGIEPQLEGGLRRLAGNGTPGGLYYQQQAPQTPQAPSSGRQKCKKVIAKIGEIIDILL